MHDNKKVHCDKQRVSANERLWSPGPGIIENYHSTGTVSVISHGCVVIRVIGQHGSLSRKRMSSHSQRYSRANLFQH